jgi:hypothetical protein
MNSDEPEKPTIHLLFGEAEAGAFVLNATTTSSINDLARAEVWLKPEAAAEPFDLFSEVKIQAAWRDDPATDLFTGYVVSAGLDGDMIYLRLQSAPSLTERNPSPRWSAGVGAAEHIYTIVREAGMKHEQTRIDGLDELKTEAMLVVVPIEGIRIDAPLSVGDVTFVPNGEAVKAFSNRGVLELVYQPLVAASTHAVYSTDAALLRDAENAGLHAIDVVLGYLQLTAAYGLVAAPDGGLRRFERENARTRPRRGEVVAVEALVTGRCWVRVPEDRTPPLDLHLDDDVVPPLSRQPTHAEQQALIAWRRAATEQDPVAQATALSDALEFYAAGVAAADMFTQDEINAFLTAIPELDHHKKAVVSQTIKQLNQAPLKRRVIEAASRDSAPLSHEDVAFLWKRIRTARNNAVHGKGSEPPTPHEIERGQSIVGRLLVYRLSKPSGS